MCLVRPPSLVASLPIGAVAAAALLAVACNGSSPSPSPAEPADPAERALERYQRLGPTIGNHCEIDGDCTSPLRCIDDACAEPPAMSGSHDAQTPRMVCYGSEGDSVFFLELTRTEAERNRGLMHRPWILDDWGMLFTYPHDQMLSFWMVNTFIPLDMIFINGEGLVVGVVENTEPLTRTSRRVDDPSRFVVEVGAGRAAEVGIAAGVRCELVNMPDGFFEPTHLPDGLDQG